ncbi:hypothetical protein [Rhizobium halophytocola]|uniref:Uncharacterized protein n=1 Tax=Rhizobium halophytocola TaxID=735519 RepID=A0ABS4E2W2_9HYPH|nr:hypothetical protein [Rhizobium halophytocola]MBP1852273.1 hypothetical protein [Rhizobium halophytocola]
MAGLAIRRTVLSMALALIFALLVLRPGAAQANESTFTELTLSQCTVITEKELGAIFECPGYRNYPVYVTDGDLRQSALFGLARLDLVQGGFESFSQFNYVGSEVEWRLDREGRPLAAILRWMIENEPGDDTSASLGQVLVISKVAQEQDGTGCVIGYVDALQNDQGNMLARQVADEAATDFACGVTQASWHGEKGLASGDPIHSPPTNLSGN